jgi:hypothetical protein
MSAPFEPRDPESLRRLLAEMRVAFDDMDAVMEDMLRTHRRQKLGYAQHRALYREARASMLALFTHAEAKLPGDLTPEPSPS